MHALRGGLADCFAEGGVGGVIWGEAAGVGALDHDGGGGYEAFFGGLGEFGHVPGSTKGRGVGEAGDIVDH